jgi:hypothetical protein
MLRLLTDFLTTCSAVSNRDIAISALVGTAQPDSQHFVATCAARGAHLLDNNRKLEEDCGQLADSDTRTSPVRVRLLLRNYVKCGSLCANVTAGCGTRPNSYCYSNSDVFQNIIHFRTHQWRIQEEYSTGYYETKWPSHRPWYPVSRTQISMLSLSVSSVHTEQIHRTTQFLLVKTQGTKLETYKFVNNIKK